MNKAEHNFVPVFKIQTKHCLSVKGCSEIEKTERRARVLKCGAAAA